jgi:hypothetical protein
MEGTVHRPQLIFLSLHIHLIEHVLPIELEMARFLPEIHL